MKMKYITVFDSGKEETGFIVKIDYDNGYEIQNVPGPGVPLAMGPTDILRMIAYLHNIAEDNYAKAAKMADAPPKP